MRFAVISDIHGNLPALEAVLEDMQRSKVDGIIAAGDYVGGPHQVETMRLLRSLDSWMIRGNADTGILRLGAGEMPPARYTALQFALGR